MTYILFIEGEYIRKIGQYPSYADIDIPQAEVYKKELGEVYYKELKRAIGLYSSNVGIGSYVYLRRILEKIILDGLQAAIAVGAVTEEQFELDENNHQRRVEEKTLTSCKINSRHTKQRIIHRQNLLHSSSDTVEYFLLT